MRYDEEGKIIENFILNKEPYSKSKILLTGKNFGCGSSREHAPWALADFGITCIISPSYADIFYNNCFNNGILPIILDEKFIKELSEYSKRKKEISVNLENEEITYGNKKINFKLEESKKDRLLKGLDNIGITLNKLGEIDNFEKKMSTKKALGFNMNIKEKENYCYSLEMGLDPKL